jgi:hypothetical protein
MELMTKAIAAKLPKLYSTEKVATNDKKVVVKFFQPWGRWTWYAVEGQALNAAGEPAQAGEKVADWYFFGYVQGLEDEWGYFTLGELEAVRGPFGLRIERDLHFGERKISEIRGVTV